MSMKSLRVWLLVFACATAFAQTGRRLQDVQLDSGITLADWVALPDNKAATPSLDSGTQAANYVRRYGPYRELLDIVWRASRAGELSAADVEADNAVQKMKLLGDARARLGDWPDLLMAQARALALTGQRDAALVNLKRWMSVVPGDYPDRGEIVAVLVESEKNQEAVAKWVANPEAGLPPPQAHRPVPPALMPYEKDMRAAAACMGEKRNGIDVEARTEGKYANKALEGQVFDLRLTLTAQSPGLHLVKTDTSGMAKIQHTEHVDAINSPLGMIWRVARQVGSSTENTMLTSEIECSGPLMPLMPGKLVRMSYTTTHTGLNSSRTVSTTKSEVSVLEGPWSTDEAMRRFSHVRIEGASMKRWKVYVIQSTYSVDWREVPQESKQYFQPSNGTVRYLFVAGPNTGMILEHPTLAPGWTSSLAEVKAK